MNFTLERPDVFAGGTSVQLYRVNVGTGVPESGAPRGVLVATSTATATSVSFTALQGDRGYVAYASSPDRYVYFFVESSASADDGGGTGFADPWTRLISDDVFGGPDPDDPDDWTTAIFNAQVYAIALNDGGAGEQFYQRLTVILPPRVKLSAPVTQDAQTLAVHGCGGGSRIDCSAIEDTVAWTVRGTFNDEDNGRVSIGQTTRAPLKGVQFIGPGRDGFPLSQALKFDTPGNDLDPESRQGSTAHGYYENIAITRFGIGLEWGDNAYATSIDKLTIFECGYALITQGAVNSGESLKLYNATLASSDYGIAHGMFGGTIVMIGGSIDYCGTRGQDSIPGRMIWAAQGQVHLIGVHVENFGGLSEDDFVTPREWFELGDFSASIQFTDCRWVVSGFPQTAPIVTVGATVSRAGITVDGGEVMFAGGGVSSGAVLFDGDGPISFGKAPRLRISGVTTMAAWARQLNLVRGDFEVAYDLDSWPTKVNAALANAVAAKRGAKYLNLTGDGAALPNCERVVRVRPGMQVTGTFWYRTGGGYATNTAAVEVYYSSGGQVNPTVAQQQLLASAGADWTLKQLVPFMVPAGVDELVIRFGGIAGGTGIWANGVGVAVDDVIFNAV